MSQDLSGLTLYGDEISGNCNKTRWLAQACGIPFDWVAVDVAKGEARMAAFLAVNPRGKVPFASFADGRILSESNAIMLYFAEATGSDLVPTEAFARAQVMSWLFWEQYTHEPAIAVRRFHKAILGKPDAEIDPGLLPRGQLALGTLETRLAEADWLVGDAFSLADVALFAYTRHATEGGFDLGAMPGVRKWLRRTREALSVRLPAPLPALDGESDTP